MNGLFIKRINRTFQDFHRYKRLTILNKYNSIYNVKKNTMGKMMHPFYTTPSTEGKKARWIPYTPSALKAQASSGILLPRRLVFTTICLTYSMYQDPSLLFRMTIGSRSVPISIPPPNASRLQTNKKTALPKECCFYFILLPEIHQCEGGHKEAVNGKAGQRGGIQEFQEPEDRGVGHYEGSDETYCQDTEVPHGEAADNLQEVVEAGQEHEGHRHDEGEVSACFSGNAKEKAAGNGAAAPREAWPEGETLEEADDEGLFRGNFIHIGNGEFLSLSHLFRHNHEDAAKHQTDDDGGGAEEAMFDEAME